MCFCVCKSYLESNLRLTSFLVDRDLLYLGYVLLTSDGEYRLFILSVSATSLYLIVIFWPESVQVETIFFSFC